MTDDAAKLRARARLALRAERAFGLGEIRHTAVAIAIAEEPFVEAHPPDGPKPVVRGNPAPVRLHLASPVVRSVDSVALSTEEKIKRLKELEANEVRGCRLCRLCETRTHTVFGEGSPDAKIFFVGEGPGQNEDEQGRPFVGRSGDFLNKQIAAMGLQREDVYIANVVKCRPPGNREPAPDEVATCTPYLERQLEIIRPQVIVTLGRPAAHHLLQNKNSMSSMRGRWHAWRGIKLMPTFHPAYLLRSYTRENRAMVWSDLQQVMREVGLPVTQNPSA